MVRIIILLLFCVNVSAQGYLRKVGAFMQKDTIDGYVCQISNDHIEFIRDDYWLISGNGKIGLSVNGGGSVLNKMDFTDYQKIEFSYIFENGNIVFATQNAVLYSKDLLATVDTLEVKYNGVDYVPVANSTNFRTIHYHNPVYIDGKEILLWGNYTNYGFEDTDVNVYFTTEDLDSAQIIYKFGYNDNYSDATGNESNETISRHVHSLNYDEYTDSFWLLTGDHYDECNWIKLAYNNGWSSEIIKSGDASSYYKSASMWFSEDSIYMIQDNTSDPTNKNGVWRIHRDSLDNENSFDRILETSYPSLPGYAEDNLVVWSYTWLDGVANTITISNDLGKSFDVLDFDGVFSEDVTFLRPFKNGSVIRMDAKPVSKSAENFTYYVQTLLLYLE